ncbi:MAG: hypothetical protein A3F11_05930 [Gammaproteobacteria bacterium RIFCSPHIGHO2_12_FULL_37_14]|nr:MAG: hypothetical protein A3F11_05930 [Gammaproteobacteria bacterium RIFCSPHIGHO2_12_FULL_37_14]
MRNNQFYKFLMACSIAAGLNFLSRILLGLFMSYKTSIIVAYLIGIITAYILCHYFVFQPKKNNKKAQIAYFITVNIFSIMLTVTASTYLANHGLWFIHREFTRLELAHFIGICVPMISGYFGHKYLSFR